MLRPRTSYVVTFVFRCEKFYFTCVGRYCSPSAVWRRQAPAPSGPPRPAPPLAGHTQGLNGLEYGAASDPYSTPPSDPATTSMLAQDTGDR